MKIPAAKRTATAKKTPPFHLHESRVCRNGTPPCWTFFEKHGKLSLVRRGIHYPLTWRRSTIITSTARRNALHETVVRRYLLLAISFVPYTAKGRACSGSSSFSAPSGVHRGMG